jgi:hypothetical protein
MFPLIAQIHADKFWSIISLRLSPFPHYLSIKMVFHNGSEDTAMGEE